MSKNNVNKIILVGHLGRDPELRHTAKGNAVVTLSLATNREFKNAEGELQKETCWHRASVWGKQAESCAKYLTKGSRVYIDGEVRMKDWTDKDGIARRNTEINVNEIKFLGGAIPSGTKNQTEEHAPAALSQ